MHVASKHLIPLIVLLIISLFASQKLFNQNFYTSHDGEGHVIRMEEFNHALNDGQFPVRLAKRINFGLGYPFFNFNYPLIYYTGELFHRIGFSFVDSFKALMVVSVVMSGVGIYLLSQLYFSRFAALASGIFFIIAPYKFLNMYVRGNVAESIGLALIPILLFSIELFVRGKKYSSIFLIASFSTLIMSHNISAVIGISLGFLYFIFLLMKKAPKKHFVIGFLKSIFVSLLLTSFFWIPVVTESNITKLQDIKSDYREFFPSVQDVIYSPWGFGAFKQGDYPGKMSPQIGVVHEILFIFALGVFLIKVFNTRKLGEKDRFFLLFVGVSILCLFLATPLSKFFWDVTPLQFIQIPWRFVGYVTLGLSLIAGYFFNEIVQKKARIIIYLLFLFLLLYANRNHIRVNQYIEYESPFEIAETYGPSTTSKDEHMPRSAPHIFTLPNQNGDIIPKNGTSKRTIWKSNYHKFIVQTNQDSFFRDNTSYFPGWVAFIDGKQTLLLHTQDEFYRLRIQIPKGNHTVEFFFTEPWYRATANSISVVTLILLSLYMVRHGFKKRFIDILFKNSLR